MDGLEKLLADSFPINRSKKNYYTSMINLVRYADDFIITGESKELLENHVKPLVIEFLQTRGLTLSEEKTKITHIEEGLIFLGSISENIKASLSQNHPRRVKEIFR